MKSKTKLFLLTIIIIIQPIIVFSQSKALYQKELKKNYQNIKYSKLQLKEDIDFLLKTIKKAHPNFYHSFTKIELQKSIDSLFLTLPDSSDVNDAILTFAKITSKFNEGHLGLTWNTETNNYFKSYEKKFPFLIYRITDSAIVIRKDLNSVPQLELADSIISINDIPVYTLIKQFSNYFGGIKEWKNATIRGELDYILYINKIHSPFKIIAKHNEKIIEFTTDGIQKTVKSNATNKTNNTGYKYTITDSIAYIDFYSMGGFYQEFKDSLKSTFTDINKKGIKKLIVDLRKNGGGNSMFGDHFLSYITHKPFRLAAATIIKISKPVKQNYRNYGMPIAERILSYLIPAGIKFESKQKVHNHVKNEPFFNGKVCFLIGNNTFSSANMMANAIQDYNLATLIGENTGESCNDYGDMVDFMLPNTQLIARTPYKYFIRANGNKNDPNPVLPNYYISQSATDLKAGKDTGLEFAKEWINKQN